MKKMILTAFAVTTMSQFSVAQDAAVTTVTTVTQPPAVTVAQPITVVEAAPLTLSKAEELRKQREQAEVETEQKIVEKLEESRMEAERNRQAAILGNISGEKKEEKKEEPAAAAVVVAPVAAQAAPAPVVEAPKGASMDDVRNAVREELNAAKPKEKAKAASQNYFSGNVGMLDYGTADVETIGAAGVSFGKVYDDRWAVEIGFGAAQAYVDESAFLYRELSQFNVGVGTKFMMLTGRVRPNVGFLVNYVNREYSELRDTAGFTYADNDLRSWAVDYGLTAGLEFAVSDNMSLGMEYRYMTNLTYEYNDEVLNTPSYRAAYGDWTPLEERDSDFWGFTLKYLF
jgi:opacity protein-like surface antigen